MVRKQSYYPYYPQNHPKRDTDQQLSKDKNVVVFVGKPITVEFLNSITRSSLMHFQIC
jgi:hypothetical protein